MSWALLALGVLANAGASVLVKVAVTPPHQPPSLSQPLQALTNLPLVAGVALYGVTFLLYAASLERLPLNVAQPVLTAGAIAVVTAASVVFFRESLPWTSALGIALVVSGVVLISLKAA